MQIIKIIVSNNSSPNIIARTIIAGNASNITIPNIAPINRPITNENNIDNITAIMHKQFLLFSHFLYS